MTYEAAMAHLTSNLVVSLLGVFALLAAIIFACLVVKPPETEEEIKDWHVK